MNKITKIFSWLIPALLFVSLFASPARAVYFQSGNALILSEKTIDEAVFVSGSSITIDSDINGDLYCAGQNIVINGDIKGDIGCAAQTLKINGSVDGNIRALAQTIEIAGQVTRNVTVASQQLVIQPKSQIKGDVFFGSQNVELGGLMGRDLVGAGENIVVSGSLIRNATLTSTKLSIVETGTIEGNLDYYMENSSEASIDNKNIKGEVTRHDIEAPVRPDVEKQIKTVTQSAMVLKTILGILSYIVLGLVIVYLDKEKTEKRISIIQTKPLIAGLVGFTVLIVAPIAFIVLLATVIGMPLSFVVLPVYIASLVIASLYASAIYGKLFIEKILKKTNLSLVWQMVTGVILLGLVTSVPLVGWAIAFASFCMGLGAILISLIPKK